MKLVTMEEVKRRRQVVIRGKYQELRAAVLLAIANPGKAVELERNIPLPTQITPSLNHWPGADGYRVHYRLVPDKLYIWVEKGI